MIVLTEVSINQLKQLKPAENVKTLRNSVGFSKVVGVTDIGFM